LNLSALPQKSHHRANPKHPLHPLVPRKIDILIAAFQNHL
jgi:hypothetical protein